MKSRLQIIIFLVFFPGVINMLQAQDTLAIKKRNIIYLVPTSVLGNMFDIDAIWILAGYDYRISNKKIIGCTIGTDIYSGATASGYLGGFSSDKTKGYNINAVYKSILKKKFYYSTNIFWQCTRTYRHEEFYSGSEPYYHPYYVKRFMASVTPEAGFVFLNKYNFFADIGIGVGIKYVHSKTFDKIGPLSTSAKESFSRKYFEFGSVVEPRAFIQYQFGYNF